MKGQRKLPRLKNFPGEMGEMPGKLSPYEQVLSFVMVFSSKFLLVVKMKELKVKLRFSAPSAGIAGIAKR